MRVRSKATQGLGLIIFAIALSTMVPSASIAKTHKHSKNLSNAQRRSLASVHRVSGKRRRGPPPPLQCYGGEMETHGHALVLSPALGHPVTKEQKKRLGFLASQDPVQVAQILNYFGEIPDRQLIDIRMDPANPTGGYKSLKHFVQSKSFTGPATVHFATAIEETDPRASHANTSSDQDSALLQELELTELKSNISASWGHKPKNGEGDETAFVQVEHSGKTIILALQLHDGTKDCLRATSSKAQKKLLPKGVSGEVVPENYLFTSPIPTPFTVTYFYGPRLFNSMNHSLALERDPDGPPRALNNKTDKPMEFMNKFWQFHTGIDFSVPTGTNMFAPYDGVVFAVGRMGCAGNTVILAHQLPETKRVVFSVYEHLMGGKGYANVLVGKDGTIRPWKGSLPKKRSHGEYVVSEGIVRPIQPGDPVNQGDFVAKSGKSGDRVSFSAGYKNGCVGGAHLHFEIRSPKENEIDLEKEMSFSGHALTPAEVEKRFRFVQSETVPINPADYVYAIDDACQTRKKLELENAIALAQKQPKAIPPLTAGRCGVKFEKTIQNEPSVYRLSREKTEFLDQNEISKKM